MYSSQVNNLSYVPQLVLYYNCSVSIYGLKWEKYADKIIKYPEFSTAGVYVGKTFSSVEVYNKTRSGCKTESFLFFVLL